MKTTMLKVLSLLMLGVLTAIACAPSAEVASPPPAAKSSATAPAKPSAQQKWDDTLAAAKKEGKVMVVTFVGSETRDAISKAFTAKYGIGVDFVVGPGSETIAKVQAERRAGLYTTDVVVNGLSTMLNLSNLQLVDPIAPYLITPEVADPKMWINNQIPYFNKAGTGVGFLSQYNSYVLRNTDLVKEGEITSYRDVLKPQWKDKVVLNDPSIPGTGMMLWAILVWDFGQDDASQWLKQMITQQNMMINRDPRQQLEWVARGKFPVGLAVYTDQLVNFLAQGAPLAQQNVKEGGCVTTSTGALGVYNNPPHPNAATVFVNWLLSKEGQTVFVSAFGGPSRRLDVKTEGVFAALAPVPGVKAYWEDEDMVVKRNDLAKIAAQVIAQTTK